jgi:hypothetical protein
MGGLVSLPGGGGDLGSTAHSLAVGSIGQSPTQLTPSPTPSPFSVPSTRNRPTQHVAAQAAKAAKLTLLKDHHLLHKTGLASTVKKAHRN